MNATKRFISAATHIIFVLLLLTQCQSPDTQTSAAEREMPDTVIATEAKDTAAVTKSDITPLTVTVTRLESPNAPVELSIYRRGKNFLDDGSQVKKFRFTPVNGKLVATLDSIPYGEFAVALYQDINSDGVINKNKMGIPTEPYAFSNNFRPKLKKPSFDNCKFRYSASATNINISLLK